MHGKQKKGERSMERKTMGTQVGVLITILGGALWGLSGACGQYLFEYKGVPIRLTMAGLTMLLYYIIFLRKEERPSGSGKRAGTRRR